MGQGAGRAGGGLSCHVLLSAKPTHTSGMAQAHRSWPQNTCSKNSKVASGSWCLPDILPPGTRQINSLDSETREIKL